MVLLPSLVLGSEIKGARVLQIWGQNHSFVTGFTGKLNSKIPGIEGHEGEVEVLRDKVLRGKRIEAVDRITESSCIADMLPGEGRQACYRAIKVSLWPKYILEGAPRVVEAADLVDICRWWPFTYCTAV